MEANDHKPPVLVGIDGSEDARRALRWALDPAKDLGEVRTLAAYSVAALLDGWVLPAASYDHDVFHDAAQETAVSLLREFDDDLIERHMTIQDSPGIALVRESADGELLVVGCRGRGALREVLLGSVGSYCIKHSKVPVAIIPDTDRLEGPLSKLVVGVDGSENSKKALRWALDHVAPGGSVVAVSAASLVQVYEMQPAPRSELVHQLQSLLDTAVAEVATESEKNDLIETEIRIGDPRVELETAALESDALVVGSRGHRGVAHLLLGSVTTSLAHHPKTVTIVVP